MGDPKDLEQFIGHYETYIKEVLKPTRLEVKAILEAWRDQDYWADQADERHAIPYPIQRVHTRIKRPEAVVDKIRRKPASYPHGFVDSSVSRMHDTFGARIVVFFLSQLPLLDREIRNSGAFELAPHDQPVAYLRPEVLQRLGLTSINQAQKESGYGSLHYVVRLRKSVVPIERRPWFEIQLRTLCEDVWAEIEHQLGYKPAKFTGVAVTRQFEVISQYLSSIDLHFSFLYDEQRRYQEETDIQGHHPLNAENLPAVAASFGVRLNQREVDGLLKILASNRIGTVDALRQAASPRRLEVLNNTFRNKEGREPKAFEVIAHLAQVARFDHDDADMVRTIETQIETLRMWDALKRGNDQ